MSQAAVAPVRYSVTVPISAQRGGWSAIMDLYAKAAAAA